MTPSPMQRASDMANVIVAVIRERGACSTLDLELAGFSAADIDRHSRNAQALAAVSLGRTQVPLDRDISRH